MVELHKIQTIHRNHKTLSFSILKYVCMDNNLMQNMVGKKKLYRSMSSDIITK